ncbi:MAG: Holliday junction branch migration protein RuvA [Actinomycetota bacterium]
MISFLRGTVAGMDAAAVEIDVAGVGYSVSVPTSMSSRLRLGEKVKIPTYLVVREDSMTLYGFQDSEQRELFSMLLGVTGVGPKLAMAAMSAFSPEGFRRAVVSGDGAALTSISGLGKRGAERIILELRQRFEAFVDSAAVSGPKLAEVREALLGLGYSPAEVRPALERVASSDGEVSDMVRMALQDLASGRVAMSEAGAPA